jgi:hypothetical protein
MMSCGLFEHGHTGGVGGISSWTGVALWYQIAFAGWAQVGVHVQCLSFSGTFSNGCWVG